MKRYLSILLCVLNIALSSAQTISQTVAVKAALNFWNSEYPNKSTIKRVNKRGTVVLPAYSVKTVSPNQKASLYVVQMEDGWMLMSSEKSADPILAYSPTGKFPDLDDMPEGMQWLMSYYEEINVYAHQNLKGTSDVTREWDELINGGTSGTTIRKAAAAAAANPPSTYVIERMANVHWKQCQNNDKSCVKPYNAMCPTVAVDSRCTEDKCGNNALVGCIAVAMGQVMWYWQYPNSAIIRQRAIEPAEYPTQYSLIPYSATYDWAHLPAELHNSTSDYDAESIAYLLRDCGHAAKLNYGYCSTGAPNLVGAANALRESFGFKSSTQRKVRSQESNWLKLLKTEISAGRPIIYAGFTDNTKWPYYRAGHAFVLYGYKGNKFRVNWGQIGDESLTGTYFSLGDHTSFQYTEDQEAIIGIEPGTSQCGNWILTNQQVSASSFGIYKCGTVKTAVAGVNIQSGSSGYIYATDQVNIRPPFTIAKGANVHIGTLDTYTHSNRNSMPARVSAETKESEETDYIENTAGDDFLVSPNPATDYIEIRSSATFRNIAIINSRGQCVVQSTNKYIPVYGLSSGLYIIRAITEDNNVKQAKFLKQ